MEKENHGLCLIINNESFKCGSSNRDGSKKDVATLKALFTELGFDCSVEENLNLNEIKEILKDFAEDERHAEAEMMILAVLSHGSRSKIQAVDGKEIDEDDIFKRFNNANCKDLVGKPKFFIFQACRGTEVDEGIDLGNESYEQGDSVTEDASPFRKVPSGNRSIPSYQDMLIFHASLPGFESYRHPRYGSALIQVLDEVFREYVTKMNLEQLLKVVSKRVGKIDIKKQSVENVKQVPPYTSYGFNKELNFPKALKSANDKPKPSRKKRHRSSESNFDMQNPVTTSAEVMNENPENEDRFAINCLPCSLL